MEALDAIDAAILRLLQADARKSQSEIAQAVGLTTSSAHERIKKLEKRGIIRGYAALVNAELIGKPLLSFIRLTISAHDGREYASAREAMSSLCEAEPDVLECHHVAGEDCYILKVRATDPKGLERLIESLQERVSITRSVTNLVFSTYKDTVAVEPAASEV
jgi:Lrp/AsnC family transcriptional regulator, leucine-responsive regulatory protein